MSDDAPNVDVSNLPEDGGVTIEAETAETNVNIHWELTKMGIGMAFLSGVGATILFYEYLLPTLF